jgi:hypothetical protein
MPRRGDTPGLKRNRKGLPYWMARQVVRDNRAFPDPSIPLPVDADPVLLAALCEDYTTKLYAWIAKADTEHGEPSMTKTRYDGTVRAACKIYQEHPHSRFHKVKHTTRATYLQSLNVIISTVGARLIRNVTVITVEHWYDQWRKGVVLIDADGNTSIGPERIDRAHDAVSILKTVIYFMAAMRHADCKLLAGELEHVKFEKGGAREQELTFAQVSAFIQKALELGTSGVMPYERALYCAIATAAQYELIMRQIDILGFWGPMAVDKRFPAGIATLQLEGEVWAGFFAWENIPGWRWRMKTSKSKYRSAADFDLTRYTMLQPLLELVPHEQRTGSIIKGEGGLPVRYRSFVRWWRQIANAAGIPVDVESMDLRASGATEAQEPGAPIEDISTGMTHKKVTTTLGYIRRQRKKIAAIADARNQSREAEKDSGTT